jgi:hypothetical protein
MNLEEFSYLLKALELMSPRQRRSFFQLASVKQMRAFEEACYNLLKNKKISKKIKNLSKKHITTIKVLGRKNYSIKTKKALLVQKGGFLGAILPILASIVTSFIS